MSRHRYRVPLPVMKAQGRSVAPGVASKDHTEFSDHEGRSVSIQLPELPLHEAGFIFAVLAATILIGPLIAKRLRLPDVVIMVLLGFAIGPTGFGLIDRAGAVEVLGGAGLLYLMFVAGLELDLDDFVKQR